MAEQNTADVGFEKQLWNAACILRGNMDATKASRIWLFAFLRGIAVKNLNDHQNIVY